MDRVSHGYHPMFKAEVLHKPCRSNLGPSSHLTDNSFRYDIDRQSLETTNPLVLGYFGISTPAGITSRHLIFVTHQSALHNDSLDEHPRCVVSLGYTSNTLFKKNARNAMGNERESIDQTA